MTDLDKRLERILYEHRNDALIGKQTSLIEDIKQAFKDENYVQVVDDPHGIQHVLLTDPNKPKVVINKYEGHKTAPYKKGLKGYMDSVELDGKKVEYPVYYSDSSGSDMHPEMLPIKGYEGLYAVCENGQIYSYPKPTNPRCTRGRWMTPSVGKRADPSLGGSGYSTVQLFKDKAMEAKQVHRLVAEHFIPNPNNYPQVNHKDGNKQNNDVSNLEWCTPSQNIKHAYDVMLRRSTSPNAKPMVTKL